MATAALGIDDRIKTAGVSAPRPPAPAVRPAVSILPNWLKIQSINNTRHSAALRPFGRDEFGTSEEAPTAGHIEAVNTLIGSLRAKLLRLTDHVCEAAREASARPTHPRIHRALEFKERAHHIVRTTETVWNFYFELFGQRQSRFGKWLVSCDWIALDCYQDIYMNLGAAKSVPAPGPFSYMKTGFSPATFRRGIPLTALAKQVNPFPLIQLPYHRLVNPWTLGAILHEVSHNLQNELGLAEIVPRTIASHLLKAGLGRDAASVWARWNRETLADLSGLLLGGPAIVASLMDVVGRSPETVVIYNPVGPHPTPYLRVFLSVELLRRMGFADEAKAYHRAWAGMYPNPRAGNIPESVLNTAPDAIPIVVNAICYTPYATLGGKSLAQVIKFGPQQQRMIEEAAVRVARGIDPGIVPERFLIGAARIAIERRLARPGVIAENFYRGLTKR